MMSRARFFPCFAAFAGAGVAVFGVVFGVGMLLTAQSGKGADPGTALLGCGISWLAGCVGAIPVAWALSKDAARVGMAILASTVLRFITVLALVAPAVLTRDSSRVALVCWVGVCYLAMLAVDTLLAISLMRRFSGNER